MRGTAALLCALLCLLCALARGEGPIPPAVAPESANKSAHSAPSSDTAAQPAEAQKTLPGPHPADMGTHSGLSALEQARLEANATGSRAPGPDMSSDEVRDKEGHGNGTEVQSRPGPELADSGGRNHSLEAPSPTVRCADGACVELGAALLSAVEGEACRSLFINGKCPTACGQGIAAVTGNESWPGCATACGNDVVSGAAERWSEICERRQETLIDQGKEVVKGLVGDGLGSRLHWRAVLQFFLAVLILGVGVGYGYRRGSVSAQYAYRLQKRRLLGRKNSDHNLPI